MTNTPLNTPAQIKRAISILKKGREFVAKGWTKGTFHRREGRKNTYCALGGIRRAAGGGVEADYPFKVTDAAMVPYDLAENFLAFGVRRKAKKRTDVADWNDAKTRTQDQVLAAYDLAIERAEKELANA